MQDTWPERLSCEEEASEATTALAPASLKHMQEEPASKIITGTSPIPWPLPTKDQLTGCAEPAR